MRRRTRRLFGIAAVAILLLAGCRQNMHDQPKNQTFEESDFFADGQASRPLPAHTVARGELRDDVLLATGVGRDGRPAAELPMPLTRALLARGRERYDIYCSPCHDRAGTGRGMIVERGYKQPPSFHIDRLRSAPPGYFFNVISQGFGVMPSYAVQVPIADRWAIIAYIRALQLSQNSRLADLTPAERQRLAAAERGRP